MADTTWQEAKSAIPAQIAAIEAGSLPDEDKKRIQASLRRIQRGLLGAKATSNEEKSMLMDDWRDLKAHQTNAAYFTEKLFEEQAVDVLQKLATLPEDDPDPAVLDKKKIKNTLRKMTDETDTPHTTVRAQRFAASKLEQFFQTTINLPEDPIDISAPIGMLTGGEIPVESVIYDMARKVAQDGAKLRPE